jgi:hypothetical protein
MYFSLFTSCTKDGLCSGKSHGILCYFMHRLLSLCTISPQHDNHQVRRSVKKKILHPTYSLTCQQKTVARTPIAITDHAIRPSSVTRNRIETKQLQLHTKVERKRSSKKKTRVSPVRSTRNTHTHWKVFVLQVQQRVGLRQCSCKEDGL